MSRRLIGAVLAAAIAIPSLAQAQELIDSPQVSGVPSLTSPFLQTPRAAEDQFSAQRQLPRPAAAGTDSPIATKAMLTSLYVTTATMQLLDVDSTLKAMSRGAVEANPMMGGLVKNRTAFLAAKAGVAAASIYAASRIARNNTFAAVATMVAMNSAYAMIVRNNYRIASR